MLGARGASLHTKALTVDGDQLFVGSYNIDPRSAWLNCEQGVFTESKTLTKKLGEIFDKQCSGDHAWHVTLDAGGLRWSDGQECFTRDPHASLWQRFQARATRALRLDAQL